MAKTIGLYRKMLRRCNGRQPGAGKPWKKLSKIERSRIHDLRAMWRSKKYPEYRQVSRWIKKLRKQLGLSQLAFAIRIGVSLVSVKRWENARGFFPSHENMAVLTGLAKRRRK
jgi:DNA-binding transcriptional regulator YiaG